MKQNIYAFVLLSMASKMMMTPAAFSTLGNALLRPLKDGRVIGESVIASSVFNEHPLTVVFVVRSYKYI